MAVNAGSHNAPGMPTGPVTEPPPPISATSKSAIKSAEKRAKFEAKKAKQPAQQASTTTAKPAKAKQQDTTLPKFQELTPPGDKKILRPLDDPWCKAYHPAAVESAWDAWWEKSGFYKPQFDKDGNVKPKGTFTIPIPPPNITGSLHCGHALATTLQDVLIRWHRMKGYTTLYVPGSDHAGISLQSIVEKRLKREKGLTRHELGREAFLALCHDWKDDYRARITTSLRRLGGSMDWSREAFTMDDNLSHAVREAFTRLHDEGLIYRANKLVNWCTHLQTTLSNLEVDNIELTGTTKLDVPGYQRKIEFGTIWYFKYPIDGTEDTLEVATTRPETMLGDSGIAVNPKDTRYQHLIGKCARHPFIDGRLLQIVADDHAKIDEGSGAVKLTPAHDPNDFEIGKRHKLEFINIYNDDGTLNANTGPFEGQRRFDARYKVLEALKAANLYSKEESRTMSLPKCSRSGDIIEPLMKPQWWMSMKELGAPALNAAKTGEIIFKPESSQKNFVNWLERINDWCLSRQLLWGHRVNCWRLVEQEDTQSAEELWVAADNETEARQKAEKRYPGRKFSLQQDDDVLDTWFSSGLWPFSTLGWPKETPDFKTFYPTGLLETGWDILFFWIARMIMLGIKLTGNVPFREVFCHSLIRDSEGRKMSKSLGNVIDPIDVMEGISLEDLQAKLHEGNLDPKEIEKAKKYQKSTFPQGIPECGTDALRFTLAHYTTSSSDINLDITSIHMFRRFCNKIYQATNFALGKFPTDFIPRATSEMTGQESLAERWILHQFSTAARDINRALSERDFGRSTRLAHQYFYDLCDTYIEVSKAIIQQDGPDAGSSISALNTLYTVLEGALTLLHPYMPFLTEELWQRLPRRPGDETPSIMLAAYPEGDADARMQDVKSRDDFEIAIEAARALRNLIAERKNNKTEVQGYLKPTEDSTYDLLSSQQDAIVALVGKALSKVTVLSSKDQEPKECTVRTGEDATAYLFEQMKLE
ncbi:MAG: valine--tRNA ligase [Chrysothrix sp. TS-e1954]|nr:MAG: valine--tRNA ligase [Chrysothrix sp. TS-e1954]